MRMLHATPPTDQPAAAAAALAQMEAAQAPAAVDGPRATVSAQGSLCPSTALLVWACPLQQIPVGVVQVFRPACAHQVWG
eukprot:scaffold157828_cov18-Tisochrysis_lutea.AAC.1